MPIWVSARDLVEFMTLAMPKSSSFTTSPRGARGEEDVLALKVPVHDVEAVHVPDGAAQLHEEAQDLPLREQPAPRPAAAAAAPGGAALNELRQVAPVRELGEC